MNQERYATMKKNAHTLYLRCDLPQRFAIAAMGYKPSSRWIVTKIHTMIAWCLEQMVKEA